MTRFGIKRPEKVLYAVKENNPPNNDLFYHNFRLFFNPE